MLFFFFSVCHFIQSLQVPALRNTLSFSSLHKDEETLNDLSKDKQVCQQSPGFELFFLIGSTPNTPCKHYSLKIKEWINLGHKGVGINKVMTEAEINSLFSEVMVTRRKEFKIHTWT